MKFENPIMNISMFEVEDVITTSGEVSLTDAQNAAKTAGEIEGVNKVITIAF